METCIDSESVTLRLFIVSWADKIWDRDRDIMVDDHLNESWSASDKRPTEAEVAQPSIDTTL